MFKKTSFILFTIIILIYGCSDEVSSDLNRDKFTGTYQLTSICELFPPGGGSSFFDTMSYTFFIELPASGSGKSDSVVVFRNVTNANNTEDAVISGNSFIFDSPNVTGNGTLSSDETKLTINFSYPQHVCSGTATKN
jgi:hypothetical protein